MGLIFKNAKCKLVNKMLEKLKKNHKLSKFFIDLKE